MANDVFLVMQNIKNSNKGIIRGNDFDQDPVVKASFAVSQFAQIACWYANDTPYRPVGTGIRPKPPLSVNASRFKLVYLHTCLAMVVDRRSGHIECISFLTSISLDTVVYIYYALEFMHATLDQWLRDCSI